MLEGTYWMAPIHSPTSPIQLPSDLNGRSSCCFDGLELDESELDEHNLDESYLSELELNKTKLYEY